MKQRTNFEQQPDAFSLISKNLDHIEDLIIQQVEQSQRMDLLKSINEVANLLLLKPPTVCSKIRKSQIPFVRISIQLYILRTEIFDYLKSLHNKADVKNDRQAVGNVDRRDQ